MTDKLPIENVSTSRQEEFLALLNPQYGAFMRYVRAMTGDPEDARDIAGETLLLAFEHFDTLRDPSSFLFYLIKIAKRQHWKVTRRGRLFVRFDQTHEDLQIDPNAAPDLHPDIALLHESIELLPLRQRESLVLFELVGLSLEEIRKLQGGSLSGVKSRVARARKKLVGMLSERKETVEMHVSSGIENTVTIETEE